MINSIGRVVSAVAALLVMCFVSLAHAADTVTVMAAASLTDALQDIGTLYEAKTHTHVTFVFAASSALAKQIENGAPADIFISADLDWMDYLAKKDLIQAGTRKNLLGNQLVLIAPTGSTLKIKIAKGFKLAEALGDGKLSVADPASVPAGKYAKAALTNLGVWDSVSGKLASADNVRGALAFVARGEAPLGIVYKTDALIEPKVTIVGTFPEKSHAPILYPVALIKSSASPNAKDFLAVLEGSDAAETFTRLGFTVLK